MEPAVVMGLRSSSRVDLKSEPAELVRHGTASGYSAS